MEEIKETWVPQSLSQLRKIIGHEPCLFGLPLFNLYYSAACKDNEGVFNRLDESNNKLHAFRIIVGLTWNWTVCNITGSYTLDKSRLNASITALCRLVSGKKLFDAAQMLNLNWDDQDMLMIRKIQDDLIKLSETKNIHDATHYFIEHLSMFAIQQDALTTLVPLDVQKEFKDTYSVNAIDAFKDTYQKQFSARIDITKDIAAWAINYSETEIREKCWLKSKSIQRLMNKLGTNTKRKYARKPSKQQPKVDRLESAESKPVKPEYS